MRIIHHCGVSCLLAGVLSCGAIHAASPAATLKDVQKTYRKISTLEADFREVFRWELTGETTLRQGSIAIAADDRFRVETPEQLMVSDGKVVYRHNRPDNQVLIEPVSKDARLMPSRLLLKFTEGFKAVSSEDLPVSGRPGLRIDLETDNPEELLLTKAAVWLTADDNVVHRLQFIDLSGNTTTYYLDNLKLNEPLDPALTTFQPPEDAEVFDLR